MMMVFSLQFPCCNVCFRSFRRSVLLFSLCRDENRDGPERNVVNRGLLDVAHSGRTLASQALTHARVL